VHAILQALRRRGQSWIVAAHRGADVPAGTTGMLVIAAGRLAAPAPFDAALVEPAHTASATASGPARRRAAPAPATAPAPVRRSSAATLLRIEQADLFVDYRPVLRKVNWTLRAGEQWAVTGANGAGKTSFLKLLYGDLSPALGGTITRRGCPAGTPIERWKRRTAYLSPELQTDYLVDVPIEELVVSGRHASIGLVDAPTAYERRIARRWLRFFELGALAGRRPRELSYGELRRALMARAMAANARLLLLDEPLTGLDPGQRQVMRRLLERLVQGGASIVMAVHHTDDLPRGITHVLHLHKRRALARGLQITDGVGRPARRSPA
jgi:ABC-type molybdenum transport system ATPase subunit/photorepair protein PhrA